MSRLRNRFREDMTLAGRAQGTQSTYIRYVERLQNHHDRPIGRLGREEVRAFLLHLIEEGYATSTVRGYASAFFFFFTTTLGRPEVMEGIRLPRKKSQPRLVATKDEVRRVLAAARSDFDRTLLLTSYAAGLRRMEVAKLRFEDVDSTSNLLIIRNGKGGKRRTTLLGALLLEELREHYRRYRPAHGWLFPKRTPQKEFLDASIPDQSVSKAFRVARDRAGIKRPLTHHSLRHAFATHLLEAGVDTRVLQQLLGHASIETTTIYEHISPEVLQTTPSPLDLLGERK